MGTGKTKAVGNRGRGRNWLVSPYYPNSGGTVIDWLPPEAAESDGEEDEGDDEPLEENEDP